MPAFFPVTSQACPIDVGVLIRAIRGQPAEQRDVLPHQRLDVGVLSLRLITSALRHEYQALAGPEFVVEGLTHVVERVIRRYALERSLALK
jgi:hypothetical protein